jgi:hypothetical protein
MHQPGIAANVELNYFLLFFDLSNSTLKRSWQANAIILLIVAHPSEYETHQETVVCCCKN